MAPMGTISMLSKRLVDEQATHAFSLQSALAISLVSKKLVLSRIFHFCIFSVGLPNAVCTFLTFCFY